MVRTEKERLIEQMKDALKNKCLPKDEGGLYMPAPSNDNYHQKLGYPQEIPSIME